MWLPFLRISIKSQFTDSNFLHSSKNIKKNERCRDHIHNELTGQNSIIRL